MGLQENGAVAEAVVVTKDPLMMWAEFGVVLLIGIVLATILWKAYSDRNIPSVVRNRVLFGLLTFGLVVFSDSDMFGTNVDK